MLFEFEQDCKHIHYFLFVNTKSGNKEGKRYTELCCKRVRYIFSNNIVAFVETFDLF